MNKANTIFNIQRKDYNLKNVTEPVLFRDIFPYSEVPRILFDNVDVPLNPPDNIWITDTTFRDGQQARPPYTVKQIVDIFKLMSKLSGPNGIIRQSEFFMYSKKDKKALEECLSLGLKYPEITGWIRAKKEDFELVKEFKLKETGILTSVSDYHIFLKLKKNREQIMNDYIRIIESALENNIIPRCHFEDITRADIFGFVLPFTQKLMKISEDAKIPIKIRLCDTLGYGLPFTNVALPRSVPKLVYYLNKECGVPYEQLEWHGHNDFHKVSVNASAAWLYGCAAANGTLLGYGERTGNPPIEGLVIEYMGLTGSANGMETKTITEIKDYFIHELKTFIPTNFPFIGADFNTTRAGIHADGVLKNEEIYNIFDTTKILDRPLGVTITDKSGVAGIAHWVNQYFELEDDKLINKRHPGIGKIYNTVMKQYEEEKRTTGISTEEMIELSKRFLPELFYSEWQELKDNILTRVDSIFDDIIDMPDLKSLETDKMVPILKSIIDENTFIQLIYVVNTEGKQITPNIVQPGTKEDFKDWNEGLGMNLSDRSWFKKPLTDGKTYITNFYNSRHTAELCLTISAPILNDKNEIIAVLGADIQFETLLKMGDSKHFFKPKL